MRALLTLFGLLRVAAYITDPLLGVEDIHAVTGEPARIEQTLPDHGRLTIVSWNIEHGTRYELIRDTLAELHADVYLLQEVDRDARRSKYRDVAKSLAHDLGMNWVFAGEFQEIGEARDDSIAALTGQTILSRYPIEDAFALTFRNQAKLRWHLDPFQPRRGGRIALRARTAGVLIYNAHIESAKNDTFRHKQVDEILLDRETIGALDQPVVFGGDFNTGGAPTRSPIVLCLNQHGFLDALGEASTGRRTSINHANPLDWIFVRGFTASEGRVVTVPRASDHFPLTTEILLSAPSAIR